MLRIICWKWKRALPSKKVTYNATHVNVLYHMVTRHLHIPHEFICITDDPEGILPEIRTLPLWDDFRHMGGCYVRLKAFASEMEELLGSRFVSIDMDTVILDDITPLFTRSEDFIICEPVNWPPYNGSMFMMNAGSRRQVWETFSPEASLAKCKELSYQGTDQAWIGACLGPHEATWTTQDGVFSFTKHIASQKLDAPPQGARLILFNGLWDPSQPMIQQHFPWVKEHWR